ncbi:MAG: hypothetical protein V3U62_03815 [Sedimenticolaceae bacterium]
MLSGQCRYQPQARLLAWEYTIYKYEKVGSGSRLSVSADLLWKITADYGLRLLVSQNITRKVMKPNFGGNGIAEVMKEKDISRVVTMKNSV